MQKNKPNVLTVGGGPHFTNINANLEGGKSFFSKFKNYDVYVVNQGKKALLRF